MSNYIGLGTWKAEAGVVRTAVEQAIRSGYRHLVLLSLSPSHLPPPTPPTPPTPTPPTPRTVRATMETKPRWEPASKRASKPAFALGLSSSSLPSCG